MGDIRYSDGHHEEIFSDDMKKLFSDVQEKMKEASAIEARILKLEPHSFQGTLQRCEQCGFSADAPHHNTEEKAEE